MDEFVECEECGFVYMPGDTSDPIPRGSRNCPNCRGTKFRFTGD